MRYRPYLIGLGGFLLGAVCVYAFLRPGEPGNSRSHYSDKPIVSAMQLPKKQEEALPPPSLAQNDDEDKLLQDPFKAMEKMHEQMEKEMQAGFGAAINMDIEPGSEITAKEDNNSISYEIEGVVNGSLNTSVKNGYLTVSGESRKVQGNFSMQSSFQRTLPLPRNVDASKMETISEKDRVVLRFPKKS